MIYGYSNKMESKAQGCLHEGRVLYYNVERSQSLAPVGRMKIMPCELSGDNSQGIFCSCVTKWYASGRSDLPLAKWEYRLFAMLP
jgi:hypothetical protein